MAQGLVIASWQQQRESEDARTAAECHALRSNEEKPARQPELHRRVGYYRLLRASTTYFAGADSDSTACAVGATGVEGAVVTAGGVTFVPFLRPGPPVTSGFMFAT